MPTDPNAGKPAEKKPPEKKPATTVMRVELRREQQIAGRAYPAGTVVGSIEVVEPFSVNFLTSALADGVCGEHFAKA